MTVKKLTLILLSFLLLSSPAFAGTKDIIYGSDSTAKSLDPHDTTDTYSGAIEKTMLQGLMGFDKNLKVIPLLAESYTFNDTATEFTFKLRKGIKFHDGTPFNAEAVRVNIERLMSGKYKRSSLMKPVKELIVIDEATVKFVLKEPFGAFINAIAHPGSLLMSPAAIQKYGDDVSKNPVGTGPFIFVEWVSGDYVKVRKNPEYWKKKIMVDTITFRPIPESGSRLAMLRAGQAQYIYPMPPELLKVVENDKNIDIIKQPSIVERYMILNTLYKPLSDQRVRQAINYALDKQAILRIAFGGAATEADSIIPADLQFYKKQSVWPFDLAKAKALMKEAGYENGFKVVFLTPNASNRLRATEMVQQQLKEINITGELQSMDIASYFAKLEGHKADDPNLPPFIGFGGWSASTGDADWGIRPLLATASFPPGSNFGFFSDKQLDDLIQAGLASADPKVRQEAYAKAQDMVWEKAPWGYLFVETLVAAKNKNLKGIYPMADASFSVEDAEMTD